MYTEIEKEKISKNGQKMEVGGELDEAIQNLSRDKGNGNSPSLFYTYL